MFAEGMKHVKDVLDWIQSFSYCCSKIKLDCNNLSSYSVHLCIYVCTKYTFWIKGIEPEVAFFSGILTVAFLLYLALMGGGGFLLCRACEHTTLDF